MSLLLLAAAIVSFAALRELRDALAIAAIVIVNIVIAVVQEEKATSALEAGDRVPADLWLLDGWSLEADESLLTGEALTVAKVPAAQGDTTMPVGDRTWMAFAGALITAGSGRGPAIATRPKTEMGRVASYLDRGSPPTLLQRNLALLTKRLGQAALACDLNAFNIGGTPRPPFVQW